MTGTSEWQITDAGRECAYSGVGNCGHMFKPWDEFYPGTKGARGYESWCKSCKNASRANQPADIRARRIAATIAWHKGEGKESHQRAKLKHLFGITPEQYAQMLKDQGGVCFLHKGPETRLGPDGQPTRLIPDHDHACDAGHPSERACSACIRGLLCHACNRLIGVVERSERLSMRFTDYLERRPLLE